MPLGYKVDCQVGNPAFNSLEFSRIRALHAPGGNAESTKWDNRTGWAVLERRNAADILFGLKRKAPCRALLTSVSATICCMHGLGTKSLFPLLQKHG